MMKQLIINCETGEVTEADLSTADIETLNQVHSETAWRDLRSMRNQLLAASDWTVLADTPTNTVAWKSYRQALRDLPANTTDPYNVVWPTPPS